MRFFLRALVVAAILILGYGLLEPSIERALYTMRLMAMPKPEMLPVPVEGVRASALRDTWNSARGEGRKHEGIDIFAKRGTPVLSSTEGIVMQVGTNRLGGLVVWVTGPGGQRHYYAHLERYADVEAGMRIEAGRVLGYVGNTGNARGTPPHLHYGVYDVGGAINPYPLLRAKPAGVTAAEAAVEASAEGLIARRRRLAGQLPACTTPMILARSTRELGNDYQDCAPCNLTSRVTHPLA